MIITQLLSLGVAALAFASPATARTKPADTCAPIVRLDYATYKGVRAPGDGVDQFLGVRFAKPPLGDLRFRAPQPPVKQHEIQEVTKFLPRCPGTGQVPNDAFAEDCLFANVFKPSDATSRSRLPVWVFIQGGGYAADADGDFNATTVVKQTGGNVVVVNFNYRVGVLGFLASERVREDGDLNAGLLDQRRLLHWVQKYIGQFGGNPDHVVIHGDSAGGGSISYHMTAYGGNDPDDLFVGAIPESPFWPTQRTVPQMEFQYTRLLNTTGCDSLQCLRGLDANILGKASAALPFPGSQSGDPMPLWYWLPVIDGNLVQDHMYAQFMTGRFRRVPTLVGDDNNEGNSFAADTRTQAEANAFLRANYPRLEQPEFDLINALYPRETPFPKHAAYFPSSAAAYGDATFTCPGNTMMDAVTTFVGADRAWNYRYNTPDPDQVANGLGVPHVAELGAIFGPKNVHGKGQPSLNTTNAAIVPVVMAYYTSFVQFLNPNTRRHPGSPEWRNWGAVPGVQGQRLRIELGNSSMEEVPLESVAKCTMWQSLSFVMDQ